MEAESPKTETSAVGTGETGAPSGIIGQPEASRTADPQPVTRQGTAPGPAASGATKPQPQTAASGHAAPQPAAPTAAEQGSDTQEIYRRLQELRKDLDVLKQSDDQRKQFPQSDDLSAPSAPPRQAAVIAQRRTASGTVSGRPATQAASAPSAPAELNRAQSQTRTVSGKDDFFLEDSKEIQAAQEAIIAQARRDAEARRMKKEEEERRARELKEEQRKAEESQRRALLVEQEALRKRQEAMEAEQAARAVTEKKKRRQQATPEEMAAFFGETDFASSSVVDQAQQTLQQKQQSLQPESQQFVQSDPQQFVQPDPQQPQPEASHPSAPLDDGGLTPEQRAIEEAKEELLSAKMAQKKAVESITKQADQATEQLAAEHREHLSKQMKREQKQARNAEKDRIRRERKDAAAIAKAQKKREKQEQAERIRLEKQQKVLAEMGAGIVKVKGVEISTEINEIPHFSWKDFFGLANRKERKTASKAERHALKEDREKRREEARAMAEMAAKKHAERYANSWFGRKLAVIKDFCDGHKTFLLITFSTIMVVVVSVAGVFNYCTAYEYSYNGKTLGIVKEKDEVLQVTDLVQNALREETNVDVVIDARDDISFKRVSAMGDVEIDSSEDVLKRLTYMGDLNVKAYGIYVDGQKIGAVESKDIAAEVLQSIRDRYTNEDKGAEIEEAVIMEDVEVRQSNTDLQDVSSKDEMIEKLCTSGEKETLHKVVSGETLADIAKIYSMKEEDILDDNPSVDPTKLQVGSTLVLKQNAPVLTVKVTERLTYEKEVAYETQEKDSADIYEGYTETQQSGENGLSEVTSRIVSVNGETIEETELVTTVKKEAVPEVILVGTKERPPTVGSGKYIWPIKDSYRLSSGFGQRWGRLHAGIDLACSVGTDIYAADGGTVTEAGYNGSYGYTILIDHQNGMETRYAHCSKLLVSKGDKVFQGQQIAESGNTGRSTGPHLHFEVHVNGTAKNPLNYLP